LEELEEFVLLPVGAGRLFWGGFAGEGIGGGGFEVEEAGGGGEGLDVTGEVGVELIGMEEGGHAVVDGFDESVGGAGDHAEAGAVFFGILPDAGGPEVIGLRRGEAMGGFFSGVARPFVVGDHGDEAAALFEGGAPGASGEFVIATVDDGFAPGTGEAPAHVDDFVGVEEDRGLVGGAEEAEMGFEADQFGGEAVLGGDGAELVGGAHGKKVAEDWVSSESPSMPRFIGVWRSG